MNKMNQKDLRSFAFLWTFVLVVIGLFPLIKGGQPWVLPIIAAAGFLFVGFMFPLWLTGFHKIWMKFAETIGFINTTIIMLFLFCFVFTPSALILKLLRKDLLGKESDKNRDTYWIKRESQPTSMKLQF